MDMDTGWDSWGCRRLQPLSPTVAAPVAYGCSPCRLRLQGYVKLLPLVPDKFLRDEWVPFGMSDVLLGPSVGCAPSLYTYT